MFFLGLNFFTKSQIKPINLFLLIEFVSDYGIFKLYDYSFSLNYYLLNNKLDFKKNLLV